MPFAPDAAYGSPDDLKRLIDEAPRARADGVPRRRLQSLRPGGELPAPVRRELLRAGRAHALGRRDQLQGTRAVREFAIHNVLYWLEEFRFDGLRFDAVDRIIDRGEEHILKEIAATVRRTIPAERHVHLVLENDSNEAHLLERDESGAAGLLRCAVERRHPPRLPSPADRRGRRLLRRLRQRRASSGWPRRSAPASSTRATSRDYRDGAVRGEPSGASAADRLRRASSRTTIRSATARSASASPICATREAVQAMQAVLLLAPQVPLLFMGEEWGATQPFCFFTDFHDELADAVREGRRREFQQFPEFASEAARAAHPRSRTPGRPSRPRAWTGRSPEQPEHAAWLELVRELLRMRHETIVPRLGGMRGRAGKATILGDSALQGRLDARRRQHAGADRQSRRSGEPGDARGRGRGRRAVREPSGPAGRAARRAPAAWSVLWLLHPRAS